jgi:hypothetical protein
MSSAGAYYGDSPPANPQFGWQWVNRQGFLYVYIEPGIWVQIGSNL